MRKVETEPREYSLYWIMVVLLIMAVGLLAVAEQAILAARKSKVDKMAEEGAKGAETALWVLANQEFILLSLRVSMVFLCLLTGGLTFSRVVSWDAEVDGWRSLITAAAATIGLTMAFALALRWSLAGNVEAMLVRLVWLVRLSVFGLAPLTRSSDAVAAALFRRSAPQRNDVDEEEIEEEVCLLLEQGAQDGLFEKAEQDMVERIFTLDDVRASALMTPRTQIIWLDLEEEAAAHLETLRQSGHSRFPVARGSLDEVVGVVFAKDLLTQTLNDQELAVEPHIRTPVFVPKSMSGLRILELFKKAGTHIALVIDEYGGVLGLITINDILEHIVGDLPLADEPEGAMAVQREDGSWLVDGMLPVDELKELLEVEELPAEDRESYQTAGGFITSYLERIPAVSEFFIWNGWRFEVLDMDRSRIDKILVSKAPQTTIWEPTD